MPLRSAATCLLPDPPHREDAPPVGVISPVMATSGRLGAPCKGRHQRHRDGDPRRGAVLGPWPPSGMWMWRSTVRVEAGVEPQGAGPGPGRRSPPPAPTPSSPRPRVPVSCISPSPGTTETSTSSTSPPAGVQARPLAIPTPVQPRRVLVPVVGRGAPTGSPRRSGSPDAGVASVAGAAPPPPRRATFRTTCDSRRFQLPDPRLPGVAVQDPRQRAVLQLHRGVG